MKSILITIYLAIILSITYITVEKIIELKDYIDRATYKTEN